MSNIASNPNYSSPAACLLQTDAGSAIYRSAAEAVARLCDAEVAGISIATPHGMIHHVLFGQTEGKETTKQLSLCGATTLDASPAAADNTTAMSPVLLDLGEDIRFYAGVPLFEASGRKFGVFFIASAIPKFLNRQQSNTLSQLGRHVATLFQSEAVPNEAANASLRLVRLAPAVAVAPAAITAAHGGPGARHLPDRAVFEKQLAHFMTAHNMQDQLFAVMSLHVDNFEDVSYSLGEAIGHALLLQIADRLRNCLYVDDLIGHGDGSHFVMVVQNLERPKDIDAVVKKVTDRCAQAFCIDGHNICITLSIGTALSALNSDLPAVLMRYADTAMHMAAKSGGNSHLQFRLEMRNHILEQTRIASELTFALEANQFELYYQPKFDLATGATSGFEALLRWNHPVRGMVAPDDFIPILEHSGLIVPVGEMVIRKACRQLSIWRAAGMTLAPIAINLSARQFESPLLVTAIETCMAEFNIAPSLLELEITESALMRDVEIAASQLQKLSQMGLRIAVDDFGTGYSSLAYLKHFPLNALKVDKTFVQGIGVNHGDTEIARTVIELAHSLGLKVIAEGVEDKTQLGYLKAHACDEVQGFYFSRPVCAKQAETFLANSLYDKYPSESGCIAA